MCNGQVHTGRGPSCLGCSSLRPPYWPEYIWGCSPSGLLSRQNKQRILGRAWGSRGWAGEAALSNLPLMVTNHDLRLLGHL
jgi:hypothetical protein